MKSILTSVNYADYLDTAAAYNCNVFDEIIVVTTKSDIDTIKVCDKYKNYTCITVPDHAVNYHPDKKMKAVFNKGHLLNHGFKYLESIKYKGYVCSTDGDTAFSRRFKHTLHDWQEKLSDKLPECDLTKMIFSVPRYMIETLKDFDVFMKNPDTTCVREKGRWKGVNHPITRLSNEHKERILLGYCQIYYIDTILKQPAHKHAGNPYYMQAEQLTNTMGLDTKLIGNFRCSTTRLNLIDQDLLSSTGHIMDLSGKDTVHPGFNFECIGPHKNNKTHLYGCHIENPELFCIHVGDPGRNKNGRVSEKLT